MIIYQIYNILKCKFKLNNGSYIISSSLAGKENRAYVSEGNQAAPSTRPTSSAGGKWANNYVPYDGFPQGSKEVIMYLICN